MRQVGAMKSPPAGVRLTMEVSCLMFDVKPNLVRDPENMGKKIKDYWGSAKKNLLNDANGFLRNLIKFDKDNISEKKAVRLKDYVDNPDFTPAKIKQASQACTAVCMWARAMYTYNTVAKEVEPKKQKLREAQVRSHSRSLSHEPPFSTLALTYMPSCRLFSCLRRALTLNLNLFSR